MEEHGDRGPIPVVARGVNMKQNSRKGNDAMKSSARGVELD